MRINPHLQPRAGSARLLNSLCGALLQGLAWAAGAQPTPQFHMRVFAPPAEAETPPPAPASRRFNMVVFQDRPAARRARPAAPDVSPPALREYPRHGKRRKAANDFTVLLATDMGYQQQHLSWAVAAPLGGGDPVAKADWDGIDLVRLRGRFDMVSPRGLAVRTEASYAWAVGGNGQQSSPGQTPSSGPANDSYAWHASAGLGYRLRFGDPAQVGAALTPLAGYALHRQRFTLLNLQENSYEVDWTGPWTGLDTSLSWLDNHELFASGQYHWASYRGTGNWRQLTEALHPNSFEHDADATGMYGSVGYRYRSPRAWGLSLSLDYQKWQANSGDERFYLANGAVINSKLSDLWLDAVAVNLGINWRF